MSCCGDASRARVRASSAFGAGLAVVLASQVARAQTFPNDAEWIPLTCNGHVVTDASGEVRPPAIDAVGDTADPAAYIFKDATWLYLRLRVSATAFKTPTTFDPYAWACLIATPETPGSYLVWAGVDGLAKPGDVALLENKHPHPGNPTQQPADTAVATYGRASNAREAAAPSQLGGSPNFFVEWAVARSDLAKVGIAPSTKLRFICGTSKTERILDGDLIGDEQGCTSGVLDAVDCSSGNCATCATEGACGPSCEVCSGAASVCNPAFGCTPECTTDAECAGPTPVCDVSRKLCVGCVSNARCRSGTTCNTLGGFCIGCTSDAACSEGTFCDTASGTCAPCAPGVTSCTGSATGGGTNVLAAGKIEGGACACDVVGGRTSTSGVAGLVVVIAALGRTRSSRRRRRLGGREPSP